MTDDNQRNVEPSAEGEAIPSSVQETDGYWRFCDCIADPTAQAGSEGKLALEQHTETGEYRTRPYREVLADAR